MEFRKIFMLLSHITSDLPDYPIENGNRHDLSQEVAGNGREALAYMFSKPKVGLAAFVYTWVDQGVASAAAMVCGPAIGAHIEERIADTCVPDSMDFYNWGLGGFEHRIDKPLVSADLIFKGEKISLNCRFDAIHPTYPASAHKDGCPPYYGIDRTEQHGITNGYVSVAGRTYDLTGFCQRDHSWGPRVWGLNQHYKWFHATTSNSAAFFFEMQSFGKVSLRGYVFKDNHMAQITDVDYDYKFNDDMFHTVIDVVAKDSSGRTTKINCIAFTHCEFNADPMITLRESPTAVTIDGEDGSGWCEFCWNKEYLEFAKNHVQFHK